MKTKYAVGITEQIAKKSSSKGIRLQFEPSDNELDIKDYELIDPIGDENNSPVPGIVHRYPDRCLLQLVLACPVYCRFCFRREVVGQGLSGLTGQQLTDALDYIENNKQIWEVILSGGDPLILKAKQLEPIFQRLKNVPHVEVVRIHTRVPIVASKKIDEAILQVLTTFKPLYIVLHINHPDEICDSAIIAINKLLDAGIVLLSQTVLLKGINDNIQTLGKLMRTLVKHRIKPYYLHQLDLAPGTSHFRVPIEQGQQLIRELRGRYSGLCIPEYVLDIPGGFGKSPIGPNYIVQHKNGYLVTDFRCKEHFYCTN